MLFSDKEISSLINANFEPAWQSVRPAPTVQIDFGNGRKLTRTLHGNIATYVCLSTGEIIDVLPGIYEPGAYKSALLQVLNLINSLHGQDHRSIKTALHNYHRQRSNILGHLAATQKSQAIGEAAGAGAIDLEADTKINETARRKLIHDKLAGSESLTMPGTDFTKWLYREVLHVDLDDPYLGLGKTLFASYPFAREDGQN